METTTEDRIDQAFAVGTPAELSVNTVSGRVSVRADDGSTIRVQAVKEGRDFARGNTRLDIQHDGNRVSINTRGDTGFLGGLRNGKSLASVNFEITVPRDCQVEIKAVSADVQVTGVRNHVRLETVSGDVQAVDLDSSVSVTTVSGDLTARELRDTLTLHTTSGDARITASSLHDFNLHSVSGDFHIETPLAHGQHYYAKTVSGDLLIVVPDGTGVTVQMRSISGDVVSDFRNAEIIRSGRRHWQGRINGGGANVEMQSVSGDLRITRGSVGASPPPISPVAPIAGAAFPPTPPVPPTPPEPPVPASDPELSADETSSGPDAASILTLLEQGEINVDEALARLRGNDR